MISQMGATYEARGRTDALKSVAILLVMLGHYAQYLATDHYDDWFRGYAYGIVALFFVLAGYGASCSLDKRFSASVDTKAVGRYYLDRALRIYPLYWLALVMTAGYYTEYDIVYQLDWYTAAIYLALPVVNAPGVFWFVPAIVLCYLAAPFLFLLLRRVREAAYLGILAASVPPSLVISWLYLSSPTPENAIFSWSNLNILFYKHLFLSSVLMFALGMGFRGTISRFRLAGREKTWIAAATLFFALMLYLTRGSYTFYDMGDDLRLVFLAPVLVLAGAALCLAVVASEARVPLSGVVGMPGRYSYPLYLFHMLFISLLARVDLLHDNDPWSLLVFLALLPLLVLFFRGVDYAYHSGEGEEVV